MVAGAGVALGTRTGSAVRGVSTGLAAAAALLLLTFLAAVITYTLAPDLAPDVAPPALSAAARAEVNGVESIDPYVADLLVGAILTTTVAFSTSRRRSVAVQ
ncbi:hypothetical protein GCM10029964_036320 [Kibdelosporangium lantanae]